jgi:hypothetical protein
MSTLSCTLNRWQEAILVYVSITGGSARHQICKTTYSGFFISISSPNSRHVTVLISYEYNSPRIPYHNSDILSWSQRCLFHVHISACSMLSAIMSNCFHIEIVINYVAAKNLLQRLKQIVIARRRFTVPVTTVSVITKLCGISTCFVTYSYFTSKCGIDVPKFLNVIEVSRTGICSTVDRLYMCLQKNGAVSKIY